MHEYKKNIKELFEEMLVEKTSEKIDEIFYKLEMNLKEEGLPNLPMKTMGGKVVWDDIITENGWRVQRNSFTRHYRILNPLDIRKGWGTEEAMISVLEKLLRK